MGARGARSSTIRMNEYRKRLQTRMLATRFATIKAWQALVKLLDLLERYRVSRPDNAQGHRNPMFILLLQRRLRLFETLVMFARQLPEMEQSDSLFLQTKCNFNYFWWAKWWSILKDLAWKFPSKFMRKKIVHSHSLVLFFNQEKNWQSSTLECNKNSFFL